MNTWFRKISRLPESLIARLGWGLFLASIPAAMIQLLLIWQIDLPTLAPLFLVAVVVATLIAGAWSGSLCAALSISYLVYHFLLEARVDPQPFAHTYGRLIDLSVFIATIVPVVVVARRGIMAKQRAQTIREEAHRIAQRFENLIQQLDAVIWEARPAGGGFLFVSRKAEDMLGYPVKEWTNGGDEFLMQVIHPEDRQRVRQAMLQPGDGEIDMEHRMLTAAGETRWVRSLVRVLLDEQGTPVHRYGVIVDITAKHRSEQALRESEARERSRAAEIQAILSAVPALVWISRDTSHDHLTGSRAWYDFLRPPTNGLPAINAASDQPRNFTILDAQGQQIPIEEMPVQRAARDGVEVRNFEAQVRFGDGSNKYFFGNATPLRDEGGTVTGAVGAFVDITARKRMLQTLETINQNLEDRITERTAELAASRAQHKAMGDSVPFGVWMTDARGEAEYFSQSFLDLLGMTMKEASGRGWMKRLAIEDRQTTSQRWRACVASGADWEIEHHIAAPSGEGHIILSRGKPVWDEMGQFVGWAGINLDITGRKRMEQQLRNLNKTLRDRAEQLRGLASELTQTEKRERRRIARILHDDLQQILAAAKIRMGRLGQELQPPHQTEAVNKISQLIDRSIDLSRSLTTELCPPQLHDGGLAPALEWITRWMDEHHQVSIHLNIDRQAEPQDPDVRELLFEAVRELIFNSVKHARVKDVWVSLQSLDHRLDVIVQDKGRGFDPDKVTRSGGFGLLSIRERLLPFHGRLEIDAAPGKGARMRISVPRKRMNKRTQGAFLSAAPEQLS